MTTHAQRAGRQTRAPSVRVGIEELLKAKVSMLGDAMLPVGYSDFETDRDVTEELFKPQADERIARMTIVWDNSVGNLPLEEVLEKMRETGAAMVVKVERVS